MYYWKISIDPTRHLISSDVRRWRIRRTMNMLINGYNFENVDCFITNDERILSHQSQGMMDLVLLTDDSIFSEFGICVQEVETRIVERIIK